MTAREGESSMRTMYDGINSDAATIAKLARPGDLVMYYIDGPRSVWTQAERDLIPVGVEHVTCTVLGNPADVGDCEAGDMTPARAAQWVRDQRARGYFRPTIYRSLSGMPDVRTATGNLILGRDYDALVADYDNSPAKVYPGSIGTQYRNTAGYDESAIYDDGWPHRSASTPPPPAAPSWPASVVLREGSRGSAVVVLQTALRDSGIRGVRGITVNGAFETQTLTAVRNFQADRRLTVDGIAGPLTRAALGVR